MKYNISDDRKILTFTVTADEQVELNEIENIQSDDAMHDFFEHVTYNSGLEWLYASETGDFTSAPMIGFKDLENDTVLDRWAFMDYQVRSVLEDLRDTGKVVFVGGSVQ